jgi:hypothetical protein
MITMIITSPVLTALSVGLLADPLKATPSERFIWSNGATQEIFVTGTRTVRILTSAETFYFRKRITNGEILFQRLHH